MKNRIRGASKPVFYIPKQYNERDGALEKKEKIGKKGFR